MRYCPSLTGESAVIKQATLIISPGGNGNHMWLKILTQAGSVPIGDDDFGRTVAWPPTAPIIHWFRSIPHQVYPMDEIKNMIVSLRDFGYYVRGLVPTRDWYCVQQSQVKRHRESNALHHMQMGYPYLLQTYNQMGVPFIFASYEAAIARTRYVEWILGQLRMDGPIPEIYDGNAKWYETKKKN